MDRFNTSIKGYNVIEVNKFVDDTLREYSNMLDKLKSRDEEIKRLKDEIERLKTFGNNYSSSVVSSYEENLKLKEMARAEAFKIVDDAKRNASRIVNDALLEADKVEMQADQLRRNITIFKRKLRTQLKMQLETIDDLDDIKIEE